MTEPEQLLCHYHYDALDRLAGFDASEAAKARFFYNKSRLTTQIQGAMSCSIVEAGDLLLAQQQSLAKGTLSALLITDRQRSVLGIAQDGQQQVLAYSAYGHRARDSGLNSPLGFNGERCDPSTGHYLLGNGYRAFNPVLMRFNNPDSQSPFGKGGLNSYAYCLGDPVNHLDPDGHMAFFALQGMLRKIAYPSMLLAIPLAISGTAVGAASENKTASLILVGAAVVAGVVGGIGYRFRGVHLLSSMSRSAPSVGSRTSAGGRWSFASGLSDNSVTRFRGRVTDGSRRNVASGRFGEGGMDSGSRIGIASFETASDSTRVNTLTAGHERARELNLRGDPPPAYNRLTNVSQIEMTTLGTAGGAPDAGPPSYAEAMEAIRAPH